ncbi:hypothetical protein SCLCIDRAFT_684040 [Scleroderma citrinum Foug A]|uniref:Uncharacterized protein n=1 Tax=Scleroderma citrinum Foug A TaxID=1036808 RepID=A0A0C3CR94_9AGAM|nr:hypothetical protein SCLCIDRAFT_684040 [Scleroderma citrinum Foug A]
MDGVSIKLSYAPHGINLGDYADSEDFSCERTLFAELESLSSEANTTPGQHRISGRGQHQRESDVALLWWFHRIIQTTWPVASEYLVIRCIHIINYILDSDMHESQLVQPEDLRNNCQRRTRAFEASHLGTSFVRIVLKMNETRSFLLRSEQYIDSSYQSFASHKLSYMAAVRILVDEVNPPNDVHHPKLERTQDNGH